MNQPVNFSNLLTDKDLARIYGFNPGTLRNWRSAGKIPFLKINKQVRYPRELIENWLKEKLVPEKAS